MLHYYCSALNELSCYQGLVLYESIKKYDCSFKIFFLCLDSTAYEIFSLLDLDNLVLIKVEQLEESYPKLQTAKRDRELYEYTWTLKSFELLYILENFQYVNRIIWLDADTRMLSCSEDIFEEWGTCSVLLTEQYYTDNHESLTISYGRFQAGLIGFRRDAEGLECLNWWSNKCLDWCYNRFEQGRWSDQKYLDSIPEMFENICVVKSLGINMTPFILYRLNYERKKYLEIIDNELAINDIKVVLFHYYGFKYFDDSTYDLCSYWMKFTKSTIDLLYVPYIEACKAAIKEIETVRPGYKHLVKRRSKSIPGYFELNRNSSNADYDIITIINSSTLQEALALYFSIQRHCRGFHWWVCCVDEESFNIIKQLNLPAATSVPVSNIMNSKLKNQISGMPNHIINERLKVSFLYHILKNNFAIKKIIYLDSSYYVLSNFANIFEEAAEHRAFVIAKGNKQKAKGAGQNHKNIIGLINSKDTIDFLEYCIDKPKGIYNFTEMTADRLGAYRANGIEYSCTFNDMIHNKLRILQDGLYIDDKQIRLFSFNNNERQRSGSSHSEWKAKMLLKKDLYDLLYKSYVEDMEKALFKIDAVMMKMPRYQEV